MEHASFNPGFPVHIYEEGMELPKTGTYFLVSGNGLWLHKDTGIVRAFVPVSNISVLQELDAEAWVDCNLPKLPACFTRQIKTFFQKVVEKYRTEASVTLYYSKEEEKYKIHVPRQTVSHGGVQYRRAAMTHLEGMEGYLRVGTIHSHCDFGAFHSGTDVGDEQDFDGVHLTFGHNDKEEFTISASVVVNGYRLKVDPTKLIDGVEPVVGQAQPTKKFWHKPKLESYFKLLPDPEGKECDVEKWLSKVELPFRSSFRKITKGDWVEWAGEMKTVAFRKNCGDGPFEVESVDKDMVTINTNVGKARFSNKLFKLTDKVKTVEKVEAKNDEGNKEDQGNR